MSQFLDLAVEEAIQRIKTAYTKTGGKIYLSFSGGKDSTILAELIKMAGLPTPPAFVFVNTGIELRATLDFVNKYSYTNKVILKPRKPFGKVLKEYGVPAISKVKSECLYTYQKHKDNPLDFARCRQLINGEIEKGGKPQGKRSQVCLKYDHFHFLSPDLDYKIANKCCLYLKKYPFEDYTKKQGMLGTFTGIRVAEGGVRSMKYNSCTSFRKVADVDILMSMPIYDWTDELCDSFIEKYQVELSKAYTEYKCTRTGCAGCPFSKNIREDLKVLYTFEPLMYKACMKWMGKVYQDQGVVCDWDSEYMQQFTQRDLLNQKNKLAMIEKYRGGFNPDIRTPNRLRSFVTKATKKIQGE